MEKDRGPGGPALATQLRVELASRDWTQADLAEKVGVTRETFNKYVKGRSPMPMPVFFAVAKVLDYSPSEFMELIEDRIPEDDRWF